MVKQEPVKNYPHKSDGPGKNLVFGGEIDRPAGEDSAEKLDITHGVIEDGKENGVHPKEVLYGHGVSYTPYLVSCQHYLMEYNVFMDDIANPQRYLERMSKPLQEKLKIAKYIPSGANSLLDVGCADGTVTLALADMFPEMKFVGIDLNADFVNMARERIGERKNVSFEHGYLRERLSNPEKFDVVLFCSVLHEFYSYGEGISTIVKALSDAHEILNKGGVLILRDMILYDYADRSELWVEEIKRKVTTKEEIRHLLVDFETIFGPIKTIKQLNHFLLKYMYEDNWEREGKENYVPVSFEQYDQIFKLLGMQVLFQRSSTIPYLKEKWTSDFGFSEAELESFRSTGIIVARK
ncbi:MAG: hypothetical protein UW42_C0013G0016 [Candidatus Collierbacteria bacterium GW2011_GWB1_44_197]|nr:MAG: hypothetical protein UW42_C0013G0016 [Candidatus Collierbacteria bacterium GW2011_GWB1_44_197]